MTRSLLSLAALSVVAGCHHGSSSTTAASPTPASPPAPAVRAPATPAMPAGVTPQLIAQGDSLYAVRSCQRCHGPRGTSGPNGPDLTTGPWLHVDGSYEQIVQLITTGVPRDKIKNPARQFQMNPRGGGQPPLLTDDQVNAIAAYVWSVSRAKTKS